jgi:hypothetical protein
MWGNRLGWGISVVIVIVTMVALYLFMQLVGTVTPATELVTTGQALDSIVLPISPRELVPVMTDDCDAAGLIRQAIEQFRAEPRRYEDFLAQPKAGAALPAVELVIQATACGRMRLFADRPDEVVMYESTKPAIHAIATVGRATIVLGLLNKSNADIAMKHYEAAYSLGAKLYEERIVYAELEAGMELMSQSARAMAGIAQEQGDSQRATALRDFDMQRLDYYKRRIEPVLQAVTSIDETIVERHAGDIARLSQRAQERAWRVEATLSLGRQRFFSGRVGDQRGAIRTLQELSNDSDPAVQLAAKKALAMTIEDYRQLR